MMFLMMMRQVHNTDSKPFEFTAALHSYFEVLSVDKAKVTGLKGEELTTSSSTGAMSPVGLYHHSLSTCIGSYWQIHHLQSSSCAESLIFQPRSGLTYLDKGKDPKNPETK